MDSSFAPNTQSISDFVRILKSEEHPIRTAANLIAIISEENSKPLLKAIKRTQHKWDKKLLWDIKTPKSTDLYSKILVTNFPAATSLKLVRYRFDDYSDLIQRHIHARNKLIEAVWSGTASQANHQFTAYEKECGWSIWLFELKVAYFQEFFGLAQQKEVLNDFVAGQEETLCGALAQILSERNEDRVSFSGFSSKYLSQLYNLDDQPLFSFWKFKLLSDKHLSPKEIYWILNFELASSPVDLYESIVKIYHNQKATHSRNSQTIGKLLLPFEGSGDRRVDKLLMLDGHTPLNRKKSITVT